MTKSRRTACFKRFKLDHSRLGDAVIERGKLKLNPSHPARDGNASGVVILQTLKLKKKGTKRVNFMSGSAPDRPSCRPASVAPGTFPKVWQNEAKNVPSRVGTPYFNGFAKFPDNRN